MGVTSMCGVLLLAAASHCLPRPQASEVDPPPSGGCQCAPAAYYCDSADLQDECAEAQTCPNPDEVYCHVTLTSTPPELPPPPSRPTPPELPPPPPTLPPLPPLQSTSPPNNHKCGVRRGSQDRITAKKDALYGEFPWMVAVFEWNNETSELDYKCGGSLIHPQVVLTATHCVRNLRKTQLKIKAGEVVLNRAKSAQFTHVVRHVAHVITHDDYHDGRHTNDPALLVLRAPVNMSLPSVGLVCLPPPGALRDGDTCVATGWGKDTEGDDGYYHRTLKKIELPVVATDVCQAQLRLTLDQSQLCAGGVRGEDTCKGDGGSPLVCPRKDGSDVYEVTGIVIYGKGCGQPLPAVYVNVAHFIDWIDTKLKERGISLG